MQVMCFLPENVKYAFCSKSYAEINWQNALPINVFFYIKIKHFFCIYKDISQILLKHNVMFEMCNSKFSCFRIF